MIGIKIVVPPPRKICDRLLGRKCPPEIIKPEQEREEGRPLFFTKVNKPVEEQMPVEVVEEPEIAGKKEKQEERTTPNTWMMQSSESLQDNIFDLQE